MKTVKNHQNCLIKIDRSRQNPVIVLFCLTRIEFVLYYLRLVGEIAQSVEQGTENPRVPGSIPGLATKKKIVKLF